MLINFEMIDKVLKIMLIEDDMIEIMKLNRAFSTLKLRHKIIEANNGEEAFKLLLEKDNLPDLILLDLNMPRMNGIEFLSILKSDENLKYIPTVILTTSSNQKDLLECFRIGVSGYVLKPLKYEVYMEKIQKIVSYWSINELIKA